MSARPSVGRIVYALCFPQYYMDSFYIYISDQPTSGGVSHVILFKNLPILFVNLSLSTSCSGLLRMSGYLRSFFYKHDFLLVLLISFIRNRPKNRLISPCLYITLIFDLGNLSLKFQMTNLKISQEWML